MIPFNFHHLYYFYTVARHGSVSKATQELKISQPALSTQIKAFQDYLNVKLFEREGRKLVLTDEGHSALAYAKQIFDIGMEFSDRLSDRSQKGRIRLQIGISDIIPKILAETFLKFILKNEPDAHILVREDQMEKMIQDLKDHLLDVVLTDSPYQTSIEEGIENHLVGQIAIVFCAHPSVARKIRRIPDDLHGAPMILPTSDTAIFYLLQEYFTKHRVTPKIVAEIRDVELIYRMACSGYGIAPLHEQIVAASAVKELTPLGRKSKPPLHDNLYLITKKRINPHPLVEKIILGFNLHPNQRVR